MEYDDFELEIDARDGREYSVAIINSPAGEARSKMIFPFDELALENQILHLQNALLRSGGKYRKSPLPDEQVVQEFGQALFDAVMVSEIRSLYDMSQLQADQKGKGLRLKLRILSPRLAALPWEFLYDPRQGEYITLSRRTPLIRYIDLPKPPQPLTVELPLRILGMIVSPQDMQALDVQKERQRVERAIELLQKQNQINLTWLQGHTWRDLQQAMRSGSWHIFHFIGHGGFDKNTDEGFVILADEQNQARPLVATQLARMLADHQSLRLVMLNACDGAKAGQTDVFSSTASILIRRGVPSVVAMQYEITDRAAIEFARSFYEAVSDGAPVDMAITEARKGVSFALNTLVTS
ncbi:MAG: CHAT domain-containing protein [Caldilineaceae bacterium]